ncbi:hypothetical protein, partial [Actinoplanes regularis]|uniref:hypothetical protein n=1 Tax=Actinoplanes regularis TaxID=52697 RepID=UPI001941DB23
MDVDPAEVETHQISDVGHRVVGEGDVAAVEEDVLVRTRWSAVVVRMFRGVVGVRVRVRRVRLRVTVRVQGTVDPVLLEPAIGFGVRLVVRRAIRLVVRRTIRLVVRRTIRLVVRRT